MATRASTSRRRRPISGLGRGCCGKRAGHLQRRRETTARTRPIDSPSTMHSVYTLAGRLLDSESLTRHV